MASPLAYLIGLGPGAPSLVTRRAAEALGLAKVIYFDDDACALVLDAFAPGAERRRLIGEHIPDDAVTKSAGGHVVARVVLGDGVLFGPFLEDAEHLAAQGIAFEIVPGVTNAIAAAAFAGVAMAAVGKTAKFHLRGPRGSPATEEEWALVGDHAAAAASLVARGIDGTTPATLVEHVALASQRTRVMTLAHLAAGEPTKAHDVALVGSVPHKALRWAERRPLFGKRVVVTRAAEQARSLCDALAELGAEPISVPTIAMFPPDDEGPLARAVAALSTYDWVAFTSPNGVERVFLELAHQGLDARAFGSAKLAAIGPGTAAALSTRSLRADLQATEHRGEGLARALLAASPAQGRPTRVLLPRARVARDALPDALRAAGYEVDVVTAYETRSPPAAHIDALRDALARDDIDILTLTSSSTVEHLVALLGTDALALLARTRLASIGPITTATAERLGLHVAITAERFSIEGLLDALCMASDSPRTG